MAGGWRGSGTDGFGFAVVDQFRLEGRVLDVEVAVEAGSEDVEGVSSVTPAVSSRWLRMLERFMPFGVPSRRMFTASRRRSRVRIIAPMAREAGRAKAGR